MIVLVRFDNEVRAASGGGVAQARQVGADDEARVEAGRRNT